MQETLELNNLR